MLDNKAWCCASSSHGCWMGSKSGARRACQDLQHQTLKSATSNILWYIVVIKNTAHIIADKIHLVRATQWHSQLYDDVPCQTTNTLQEQLKEHEKEPETLTCPPNSLDSKQMMHM